MKKNKFLALLLTCAMTVTVLAGCGSKNSSCPKSLVPLGRDCCCAIS